jgi:hypothetical protein
MFAITAVACVLTFAGTLPWTMVGSFFPATGFLYNGMVALLSLRTPQYVTRGILYGCHQQ